jgi:hypothetical protein
VVAAFADQGVALVRTPLPRAVVADDDAYRGAVAYRHFTTHAGLFVLVCRSRCVNAPPGLRRESRVPGRATHRLRQFSTLGNNIAVFSTNSDGRSGRRLQARVQPVLNELDAAEDPDSRCYIN